MGKKFRIGSNKGFSLAELLVALTILVIAATAFVPVFSFVAKANSQNKIRSTANSIATAVFEEISSMKYDDIGTTTGNPSGTLPASKTVQSGGINYSVETFITWGSTTDLDKSINPSAYKNIRVTVKAWNAFSGTEEVVDKVFSIAAKEAEPSLSDKGNIIATVKQADNLGHENPRCTIIANGPSNYTMDTDYGGQVIFGEITRGTYNISMTIPTGYYAPQGDAVGSTVSRPGIAVNSWDPVYVYFYIDKLGNFSSLSVKLVDDATGSIIDSPGNITLAWDMDGSQRAILSNKAFTNGTLDSGFIGRLWPLGRYSITVDFPAESGYKDYDMSSAAEKPLIEGTTSFWDGTFSSPGDSKSIIIRIKKQLRRDAYTQIEAEDYDRAAGSIQTVACEEGGQKISNIQNNDYTVYEQVDFGSGTGASSFQGRVSAGSGGGKITIRVDSPTGPVIGNLWVLPTGSNQAYSTQTCWANSSITGLHDVYLIYTAPLDLNWFKFSKPVDDFNDNSINNNLWYLYQGSWEESDGVLKQTNTNIQDPQKAILSKGGFSYSEHYTILAKVKVDYWRNNTDYARGGVGLFANTSDGCGYNLLFHNRGRRNREISFLDDHVDWGPDYGESFTDGTWYWFMLRSEGPSDGSSTTLRGKIWEDGDEEPDWQYIWNYNTTRRTGFPALNGGSGNCRIWFDDVSVIKN